MEFTIVGATLAAAGLAYALISHARTHAVRRREAEFFARHLRGARRLDGPLRLLIWPADQSRT
jgi:hypothetical protein